MDRMTQPTPDTYVTTALKAGRQQFMGLEFLVAKGALVPRVETELLARTAIDLFTNDGRDEQDRLILDLCCGVGNLACAIAHYVPNATVFASDLSSTCVGLAQRNVDMNSLGSRIRVLQGDLFDPYKGLELERKIAAIVCNPPYISEQKLKAHGRSMTVLEPVEAFHAGPYGLAIHQRLCRESAAWLIPGGLLIFEFGSGQAKQVSRVIERAGNFAQFNLIESGPNGVGVAVAELKRDLPLMHKDPPAER